MANLSLKCQCGQIIGSATDVTPSSGNRVVCCCSSCQAFATHLGAQSNTLDAFGGTEIIQMSQSQVNIVSGQDKLQCMRLKEKGLLRWYASCCNTPIGNTISAGMPFVGVIHSFIDEPNRESVLGPVLAHVQTQYATGEPDYPKHSAKYPLGITVRIMRKMLVWKIQGKQKPSVFFGDDSRPVVKPIIASKEPA